MEEKDFILPDYDFSRKSGKVSWKAPSNIAIVKYWGKKGNQIPANPSLSFTLDTSATTTSVEFELQEEKRDRFSYDLFFDGKPNQDFRPKIDDFFARIEEYLPFLKSFHLKIDTANSFPHSSGIASSASGFAALSLCLTEMESQLCNSTSQDFFLSKASFLARLGSGSAARSIQGPLMHWGYHSGSKASSDLYAIPYPNEIHPVFLDYQDVILLVDRSAKAVSSTQGHDLMKGHLYADSRFEQAHSNLEKLNSVFKKGDLSNFITIMESEALSLHAMMMTSIPYYLLMKPNTVAIIEKVWEYRSATGVPLGFTLDAGANVHLLFPGNKREEVYSFIQSDLIQYCDQGAMLKDRVGLGGVRLS
ncbi:MAG: diphosphomevalonate decarboxylase [Flavobacteriaceae bacterium]